eukprot:403354538
MSVSDEDMNYGEEQDEDQELTHPAAKDSLSDDEEEEEEQELTHPPQPANASKQQSQRPSQQQINQQQKQQRPSQTVSKTNSVRKVKRLEESDDEENYEQEQNQNMEEEEEDDDDQDEQEDEDKENSRVNINSSTKNNSNQQQPKKLNRINNLIKVNQSPVPSPPKQLAKTLIKSLTMEDSFENYIKCEIKDIQEFKWCLDSVRFQTGPKKFNDVVFQALMSGITLKSHSQQGTIMTKCMLKKDFFGDNFFDIQIRKQSDLKKDFNLKENAMQPLIEFCLPFSELKQIVDGMVDEDNVLQLEYPTGDNYLEVRIPEETKGTDKIQQMTTLKLETYEASHNLWCEKQLKPEDVSAQVFGKILHFKKALKEFTYLGDKEAIEIKFSENYPNIQLRSINEQFSRNHVVKFNLQIDDLVTKKLTETSAFYTIESLRLGFSRITNDALVCIVTMYNEGYLSVKHMNDSMVLMIESIILPLDGSEDDE